MNAELPEKSSRKLRLSVLRQLACRVQAVDHKMRCDLLLQVLRLQLLVCDLLLIHIDLQILDLGDHDVIGLCHCLKLLTLAVYRNSLLQISGCHLRKSIGNRSHRLQDALANQHIQNDPDQNNQNGRCSKRKLQGSRHLFDGSIGRDAGQIERSLLQLSAHHQTLHLFHIFHRIRRIELVFIQINF